MSNLNDLSIMQFGEHKGKQLANVPDEYLIWFWGENKEAYLNNSLVEKSVDLMKYIDDSFDDLP